MTPDQIKAMSDEDLSVKISALTGQVKGGTWRCYSTDLNAAWGLQWSDSFTRVDFEMAMLYAHGANPSEPDERCGMYFKDPRRCARLICEAFLYLKTKGE